MASALWQDHVAGIDASCGKGAQALSIFVSLLADICPTPIETLFGDACVELVYFLHSRAAMFEATVLRIQGDSKTAVELHCS